MAITSALTVKAYVVEAYEIPSESMVPTLEVKDKVIVNKLTYHYSDLAYGDVVVFKRPPGEDDLEHQESDQTGCGSTRRHLGRARDGVLYRNGERADESYLPAGTLTDGLPETVVPPGQVFFMGDNRDNSQDGRYFGTVEDDLVVGKAEARVWPLARLGQL